MPFIFRYYTNVLRLSGNRLIFLRFRDGSNMRLYHRPQFSLHLFPPFFLHIHVCMSRKHTKYLLVELLPQPIKAKFK